MNLAKKAEIDIHTHTHSSDAISPSQQVAQGDHKNINCLPSWKKFSENFLKFTEIYLNHIWKIAYYHFVPLNQFWTHFSNIAELSEKSELFWICLKNLNCFENCWNSLNSICILCIVLKQSELFWILLKQSELF